MRLRAPLIITIVDGIFALLTATLVLRPQTPVAPAIDWLSILGVGLGCATLGTFVNARSSAALERRPSLAIIAAIGWVMVFVVGLGPLGTPPPWWSGPLASGWLAPVYRLGIPQLLGLAIVMVGLLDAGRIGPGRNATSA